MAVAKTVDEFLAALPSDQREAVMTLQRVIRAAAPGATEQISYGVPSFKLDGRPLVSVGAAKEHCSFYVQSPEVMQSFADELKRFHTAKGTIHFAPDAPLPEHLVTRLVQARIAENAAATAARTTRR
jgi:uncharacterized protein YdhG (YjbR/CyaY superfamily)